MQTYIGKRSTGNDTTDIAKDVHYLFFGVILFAGCHEQPPQDPDQVNSGTAISTDLQSDLWHAHRHVHDGVQVHDHEHESGFTGGHEHQHGHAHRHSETPLDGTIVSLRRLATPGQGPGSGTLIPYTFILRFSRGFQELNLCLLSGGRKRPTTGVNQSTKSQSKSVSAERNQPNHLREEARPRQEGSDFPFFASQSTNRSANDFRKYLRHHISVFALTIETSDLSPRRAILEER